MLEEMDRLIKMIAEQALPPDMKLYEDNGKVLFLMMEPSGVFVPNMHQIYISKVIDGFNFTYSLKFKDLQAVSDAGASVVKRATPYFVDGIKKAVDKFNKELSDPAKRLQAVYNQKLRDGSGVINAS